MKKFPNWERYILTLKFTNNKMVCIRYLDNDYIYFSRNTYKTLKNAITESDKYIMSHKVLHTGITALF
jgi:hypothetical protein